MIMLRCSNFYLYFNNFISFGVYSFYSCLLDTTNPFLNVSAALEAENMFSFYFIYVLLVFVSVCRASEIGMSLDLGWSFSNRLKALSVLYHLQYFVYIAINYIRFRVVRFNSWLDFSCILVILSSVFKGQ